MGIEDLKAKQAEESGSGAESATDIKKKLDRIEAKEIFGAPSRLPKEMMLDASDAQARHPELHLRFVNIKDPNKAAGRLAEGYRRLSDEEGGRHLGDELALFGISREVVERKRELQRQRNEMLLTQYKHEMEGAVEAVARELRDRHGVNVDTDRIFIRG